MRRDEAGEASKMAIDQHSRGGASIETLLRSSLWYEGLRGSYPRENRFWSHTFAVFQA